MCGRYSLFSSSKSLSLDLGLSINIDLEPSYNIGPSDSVLTVYLNKETQKRMLAFANWGLKTPQNFHINSRIETVDTSPRFRDAWQESRSLIPANGFYEWYQDGVIKQPYYIFHEEHKPIYFGGLDYSLSEEERSAVIVTCEANEKIKAIHSRMPLIIPLEHHEAWLNGEMSKEDAIHANHEIKLEAHTVSSRVNKVINNDTSLIEKKDPIKDDQLRLF